MKPGIGRQIRSNSTRTLKEFEGYWGITVAVDQIRYKIYGFRGTLCKDDIVKIQYGHSEAHEFVEIFKCTINGKYFISKEFIYRTSDYYQIEHFTKRAMFLFKETTEMGIGDIYICNKDYKNTEPKKFIYRTSDYYQEAHETAIEIKRGSMIRIVDYDPETDWVFLEINNKYKFTMSVIDFCLHTARFM